MFNQLRREFEDRIEQFTRTKDMNSVILAFRKATDYAKTNLHWESIPKSKDNPTWFAYEHALWDLSETLRLNLYRGNRNLSGKNPLSDFLEELCLDPGFGKGRQNLVTILSTYGKSYYRELFAHLLDDNDVYGHALKALNRIKDLENERKVSSLSEQKHHGWINKEIRNYLKRAQENRLTEK